MPATEEDYARLSAWAALKNPDANIDRRKCHRTVPLEVLNLSAPRTGTLSMNEGLRILGYQSPYHYSSVFESCRDADMWKEALDAKFRPQQSNRKPYGREDFDKLLGHCGAVGDAPSFIFWRELLDAYPDAKVILMERDEKKWLASMRQLVEGVVNPVAKTVRYTDPERIGRILGCGMKWIGDFFETADNLTVNNAMANASEVYRKHYAEIRAAVPKERLLEYKLGDGWEPLCQFLGKEKPEVEFPHRNDAQTMEAALQFVFAEAIKASLRNISVVVGGLAVAIAGGLKLYQSVL